MSTKERAVRRMLRVQDSKRQLARTVLMNLRADMERIARDRDELTALLDRDSIGGALTTELAAKRIAALDRQQAGLLVQADRALQEAFAETVRVRLIERLQRNLRMREERTKSDAAVLEIVESRYARARFP